ncbi:MAG TPA: CBS domain-containing protein [Dehalococcoidia bacterium]|nr:CBS domain-containing protein [Dehalococcoidia bacterium]
MSPRAAWRLETLHFDRVYDYVAGKEDWVSAGFPTENYSSEHRVPVAADTVRRNVPTCRESDRLGSLRSRGVGGGCVVLNGEDIVLGRISDSAHDHPDETPVEQVMDPGPTTIRPGTPLDEIAQRMKNAHVDNVLVSTAEGKFVGILYLEDAEREK